MFCYGGKTELRERSVIASRSEFLSSLRFVTFPNASLTQWLLNDHEKGGLGGGREKDLHISQIFQLFYRREPFRSLLCFSSRQIKISKSEIY